MPTQASSSRGAWSQCSSSAWRSHGLKRSPSICHSRSLSSIDLCSALYSFASSASSSASTCCLKFLNSLPRLLYVRVATSLSDYGPLPWWCHRRHTLHKCSSPSPILRPLLFTTKNLSSPEVRKAKTNKADPHRGHGQEKPRPKKAIDNIDFQTSAVQRDQCWGGSSRRSNANIGHPVGGAYQYMLWNSPCDIDLQVNYINSSSLKYLWHCGGQATPICDIGGAAWATVVCLVHSLRSSGRRVGFIGLTGIMLTEEAVDVLVGALRFLPPRDAAEEPETLEVRGPARLDLRKRAGCAQVSWSPIRRKRSPKPTQRAGPACLGAPEIGVKRGASNASASNQVSVNKCVWQRKCMGSYLPVRSLRLK